ncbi:MAG TPA: hypothetical protein VNN80_16260 [Polyangiaceae bacterium]|nr:hypothetical protein [Polyangiaceae bacterium]
MAKETQDTVGEVDAMPVHDSETELEERESSKVGLAMSSAAENDEDDPESADEPSDASSETAGDQPENDEEVLEASGSESAPLVSAPPSLALWLSGELRPSPSKSMPPAAPPSAEHPETLAPVAVPQAELSDEDLAVLPVGSRPGESRSLRNAILAVLGVAAAVFLFTTSWSPRKSPEGHSEAAAQPVPGEAVEQNAPVPPARTADLAPPSDTASEEPAATRSGHGRWVAPAAGTDEALDEEARLRGPSVGRFPDLPQEYWSELRRRELEGKAERQRQLLEESLAPEPSLAPESLAP